MCNNNYALQGTSMFDVIKICKKSGILSGFSETGEMGIKDSQSFLSSFSQVKREVLAEDLADGDGPGNGGGSPLALPVFF